MNITPDSFSDGGNFLSPASAVEHALRLFADGADVVELGAESTRPGATAVDVETELARMLPVLRSLARASPGARIAVDTVHAETARVALTEGAGMINDVSALRLEPEIADVCAIAGCELVLMHSRGNVADMARYEHATYTPGDVMGSILTELLSSVETARSAGVASDRIVLDPGLGFSKRGEHSVEALAQLPRLVELGFPVMIGASRKRFVGEITGVSAPVERDAGTVGANVVALTLGARWFRVHNVAAHRHALDAAAAILEARA